GLDWRLCLVAECARVEAGAAGVAATVAAEGVEKPRRRLIDENVGIHKGHRITRVRVAPAMVRLRHRIVAGVAGNDLVAWIERRSVRLVVMPVLSGNGHAPFSGG